MNLFTLSRTFLTFSATHHTASWEAFLSLMILECVLSFKAWFLFSAHMTLLLCPYDTVTDLIAILSSSHTHLGSVLLVHSLICIEIIDWQVLYFLF